MPQNYIGKQYRKYFAFNSKFVYNEANPQIIHNSQENMVEGSIARKLRKKELTKCCFCGINLILKVVTNIKFAVEGYCIFNLRYFAKCDIVPHVKDDALED